MHVTGRARCGAYIEDVRDPDGLEELGAGGVVVAAEEEELLEDLRRERGVLLPRPRRRRRGRAVAADAAHLPLLVLVVVPANPARVLPLPLPHLVPFLPLPHTAAAALLDPPRPLGYPGNYSNSGR